MAKHLQRYQGHLHRHQEQRIAKNLYQEQVERTLQDVGCTGKLDFGRWMRDEGGGILLDAAGQKLERTGWVELSDDQLQLLTDKLGACNNVWAVDLTGERCCSLRCVVLSC